MLIKTKSTPAKSKGKKAPKGGMSKAQLGKKGSAIMSEAQKIRKASPGKKWRTCVAEAGKKMKGK